MWIFTPHGFISAVKHRDYDNVLIVRARRREHLEAVLPGRPIEQTDNADYRYRTQVLKGELAAVIAEAIQGIDYDNFKNSIPDNQYHDACSGVWSVMHRLQPGSWYQGVTLAHEYAEDGEDLDQPELWPQDDDDRYSHTDDRERLRALVEGTLTRCQDCGVEQTDGSYLCSDCDITAS
jgi:hypothetical protein